jgi:hypothetical protein
MPARLDVVRLIWTICFGIGAFNHARDIFNFGWLPYTHVPMPVNAFWTALLPLDIMAAALVWVKPKVGAMLGAAIMLADVGVNSWVSFGAGIDIMLWPLGLQALFLLFVLITFRRVGLSDALFGRVDKRVV